MIPDEVKNQIHGPIWPCDRDGKPYDEEGYKKSIDKLRDRMAEKPGGSTPSQYRFPKGLREIQDLVEYRNMNFAIGNIFKACFRMGTCSHSDKARDLRKILWFAQRELDRLEDK